MDAVRHHGIRAAREGRAPPHRVRPHRPREHQRHLPQRPAHPARDPFRRRHRRPRGGRPADPHPDPLAGTGGGGVRGHDLHPPLRRAGRPQDPGRPHQGPRAEGGSLGSGKGPRRRRPPRLPHREPVSRAGEPPGRHRDRRGPRQRQRHLPERPARRALGGGAGRPAGGRALPARDRQRARDRCRGCAGAPARGARHARPRPARRPRHHRARGRPGDPPGRLALHRSRLLRRGHRPVRLRQVDPALGAERHPRDDGRRRAAERRRPPPRVRRLEVPARVRAPGRHRPSGADRRGKPRLHGPAAPAAGHLGRGARQTRGRRVVDAGAHRAPGRAHPSPVRRPAQAGVHRDRALDRAQPHLPGRAHQRPRPRPRGSADAPAARAELQGQDGRAGHAHPRPHRPVRFGGAGDGRPAGVFRARRRGQGALRHRPHRQPLHAAQGKIGRGVERGLHFPRACRPRRAGEARGHAGSPPPAGRGARSGSSRS